MAICVSILVINSSNVYKNNHQTSSKVYSRIRPNRNIEFVDDGVVSEDPGKSEVDVFAHYRADDLTQTFHDSSCNEVGNLLLFIPHTACPRKCKLTRGES
jgi:hypothetical protein